MNANRVGVANTGSLISLSTAVPEGHSGNGSPILMRSVGVGPEKTPYTNDGLPVPFTSPKNPASPWMSGMRRVFTHFGFIGGRPICAGAGSPVIATTVVTNGRLGGGVFTITWKLHILTLPQASVAVQVTVVVPRGKSEPLAGVQTTATLASQMSETTGANVTATGTIHGSTTMSAGQVMSGFVVSTTVTVWWHVAGNDARTVAGVG